MRSAVKVLLTVILFAASVHAQAWSGILSPSRAIDWTQSGIPGGIPLRTTACATINASTYGNGANDATSGIQNALNSCASGQAVTLSAGTFLIRGSLTVPANVTLRGNGADSTVLNAEGATNAVITLGGSGFPSISNSASITSGATAGSTSIGVSSASGISTGMYLIISELNDSSFVSINGSEGACTFCDGGIGWNGTRAAGQIVEVTSVSGTNVGFKPALYMAYPLTPLATSFTALAKFAGVENLQVFANNSGYSTNFAINMCAYCWISGVEGNYADGDHVETDWSYGGVIQNSYFSNAYLHTSGAHDSDVDLRNKTSGMVVQNNIFERLYESMMLEWGSAGNVIAYNYIFGGYASGSSTFLTDGINTHGAHPMFNLFEGNITQSIHMDSIWGSHSDNTLFRNWSLGTTKICSPSGTGRISVSCSGNNGSWAVQANRATDLDFLGSSYNLVGDIVGSLDMATLTHYNDGHNLLPQVDTVVSLCGPSPCGAASRSYDTATYDYSFGYGESSDDGSGGTTTGAGCNVTINYPCHSLIPYSSLFLHGEYSSATGIITWANGVTHVIPASFYLTSKPTWFGNVPWPTIGPDVTGGLSNAYGHASAIPAESCYENVMHGTDGTGSPLTFNAAACYGAAPPPGGLGFPYGNNCGGCGIPGGGGTNNIITSSINCILYDSNPADAPIQCDTSVNHYTLPLPPTVDPRAVTWTWNQTVPASCVVVTGAILNTTDRTQAVDDTGNFPAKSTSCKVTVHHLVPGSALGNAGNTVGDTMYLAGSTDGSTSNPGGTNPGAGYGNGWSAYPGPVGNNQGPAGCCFLIQTPNPQPVFPMQWELTMPGTECQSAMPCNPGYPNMLPLYLLWTGGNAPTVAGLGTVQAANTVAHTYSSTYSAPNSGQWYTSNGSAWVANGSGPVFVWTATITQGGNTYNCAANANGGVDPTTHQPTGTCKTSGGADSGIAVIPFYAGIFEGNSPSTDYRQIGYNSSLGKYFFDMNGAAPPLNPQPTSVAEFFPGTGSITGAMTLTLTGTVYTSGAMTAVATGTTPVTVSYPLMVAATTPVTQSTPSFSTDPLLPAYFAFNAAKTISMFTNQSTGCSMDNWNIADSTYMWYPFGAGSFAECQTWNYDNSRVATSASDQFLHKMDGTAWPTSWTGTHTYGDNYADEELCPASDTSGNCWVATNSSCLTGGSCGFTSGGSEPSWSSHPSVGSTVTDGTGSWINSGNQAYWNRNVKNSGEPYLNNLVLTDGAVSQFSQFSGGLAKNSMRTAPLAQGGAVAKSGGVTTGLYGTAVIEAARGDFGGGLFSPFSDNAGRGAAYELDSLMTQWRQYCQQGNCSTFTGNPETMRVTYYDINSTLNYWNLFGNQPEFSTSEPAAYGPVIIPFYIGLGTEAIIETLSTCHELDPGSTLDICKDTRMIPYLKAITGYMYQYWWNQTAAAGEGVSNNSFSYDPRDVQNHTIIEPFFTELTGPMEPAYDWMYNYCGGDTVNCVLPGGTHYDVAADSIREHQFDGRNCSNWTCIGGTKFFGHVWSGGTGSPKQLGQANKWGLGNSYNWRMGFSDYLTTDLTPSRNPCWTTGNTPCASASPYADTLGPYPFQIINPGSSGQDDPGAEGHFTGRSDSPVYAFSSTSANIQFWTYEQTVASKVSYGANPTCNTGSVTTEDAGYPLQQNLSNVTTYLHHFTLTGLTPSTNYFLQLSATDAAGNTAHNSCAAQSIGQGGGINFTTLASTGPVILTSALPNGSVETVYSTTLLGSGGFPPYTFTVTGTLPPGLTFTTPTISGTPTGSGGVYPVVLNMTDSHSTPAPPVNSSITITDLTITTASLPNGTDGTPYSQTLAASGGTGPYTWGHILGILPPGLGLDPSTGIISGTPTDCALYPVTWKVTDSSIPAITAAKPLSITITGCTGAVTITTPLPLHNCVVNIACPAQTETASGGTAPYTWAVTSGSLPTGMTLHSSTGILDGTPTATGTASFSVTATDSGAIASTPSAQSITVISTSQLGVTITGSTKITGNVTVGTPGP